MSCYKVEFEKKAREDLKRLDYTVSSRIRKFLRRIATQGLPRSTGKPLTGNLAGLWRYRVGDYRLMAHSDALTRAFCLPAPAHLNALTEGDSLPATARPNAQACTDRGKRSLITMVRIEHRSKVYK